MVQALQRRSRGSGLELQVPRSWLPGSVLAPWGGGGRARASRSSQKPEGAIRGGAPTGGTGKSACAGHRRGQKVSRGRGGGGGGARAGRDQARDREKDRCFWWHFPRQKGGWLSLPLLLSVFFKPGEMNFSGSPVLSGVEVGSGCRRKAPWAAGVTTQGGS